MNGPDRRLAIKRTAPTRVQFGRSVAIRRVVRGTLVLLLLALFLLIAWRRSQGALVAPLGGVQLAVAGLAAAAVVCLATRWSFAVGKSGVGKSGSAPRGSPSGLDNAGPLVARLAAVGLMLAIWLPNSSLWGLSLGWAVTLAAVLLYRPHWRVDRTGETQSHPVPNVPNGQRTQRDNRLPLDAWVPADAARTDPSLLQETLPIASMAGSACETALCQTLRRWRCGPEEEALEARMRATFEPAGRLASLHVAFCPPFRQVPETMVEQLDGPEAEVRLVQVLAYGARIDVRLRRPAAEPTGVTVQLEATGPV